MEKHISDQCNSRKAAGRCSFRTGNFEGIVRALKVQADKKILIGGERIKLDRNNSLEIGKVLLRINSDGSLDKSFTFEVDSFDKRVNAIQVSDQEIYIGGNFTSYQNTKRKMFVKLDTSGLVDDARVILLGFVTFKLYPRSGAHSNKEEYDSIQSGELSNASSKA